MQRRWEDAGRVSAAEPSGLSDSVSGPPCPGCTGRSEPRPQLLWAAPHPGSRSLEARGVSGQTGGLCEGRAWGGTAPPPVGMPPPGPSGSFSSWALWMSLRLLFFEETEDYIFYREQVVFLIFVSFFRCNFYLCSDPNSLVWVRDWWHPSRHPFLAGAPGALPGEPRRPDR